VLTIALYALCRPTEEYEILWLESIQDQSKRCIHPRKRQVVVIGSQVSVTYATRPPVYTVYAIKVPIMVSVLNNVRIKDFRRAGSNGWFVLADACFRTTEVPAERTRKGHITAGSQSEREIHQVLVTECQLIT